MDVSQAASLHPSNAAASNGVAQPSSSARLDVRARCLSMLRRRLGGSVFLNVASFVPMSCQAGLLEGEDDKITKEIQFNLGEQHWMASYIDRPHASTKVSAHALAEAIMPDRIKNSAA